MTPEPRTLRATREETIDALCRRFATDELSMGELERRLEKARSARSRAELQQLVADLPPVTRELPQGERRPARRAQEVPEAATSARPARREGSSQGVGSPSRTSSHLAIAVMAGTRRAGRWVPPSSMSAVAIMGGVELDFRDAVLSGEEVDIMCFAFWGGVEIVVPPGVHVDTRGFALMGGFDQTADVEDVPPPPPGAAVIRVNGLAIMGGVEVKVAERGEKLAKNW